MWHQVIHLPLITELTGYVYTHRVSTYYRTEQCIRHAEVGAVIEKLGKLVF